MKAAAHWFSIILFAILFCGVLRTVLEGNYPFIRKLQAETRDAYILLLLAATGLFTWTHFDLHVQSVEIAGVRASVGQLQHRVNTLSQQMEVFFQRKRIEVFDQKNWSRVRLVRRTQEGVVLQVTLVQQPIPGSVEVYEGVLLMPETMYHINGRELQFTANTDKPNIGLTIKYYPRISGDR